MQEQRTTIAENSDYSIVRATRRLGRGGFTRFEVFEYEKDGSPLYTWEPSGQPRASIDVEVWHPENSLRGKKRGAYVSWPSTSDKRPALARALSEALARAAEYADRLDEAEVRRAAVAEQAATETFADRESGSVSEEEFQKAVREADRQFDAIGLFVKANDDYQEEIPIGSFAQVVDVKHQNDGIFAWRLRDENGRTALVPAGSQEEVGR